MRWFHWVNFPLLAIMIWSGFLIYWANPAYDLKILGFKLFHFFPKGFYKALNIPFHLADGMAYHFLFMWFFTINGILYVIYTVLSGEWRHLLPVRNTFKEAWLVMLHDLKIRTDLPVQGKYNAAQRIAYSMVILMGVGSLLTGLVIYKPVQFNTLCNILGGYAWARAEHFILTIGYLLFLIVHIVQVVIAGWNNFRSVVTGFEVVQKKEQK